MRATKLKTGYGVSDWVSIVNAARLFDRLPDNFTVDDEMTMRTELLEQGRITQLERGLYQINPELHPQKPKSGKGKAKSAQ